MSALLKSQWRTERLHIRNSVPEDAIPMRDIFNACVALLPYDPTFYEVEVDEIDRLIAQAREEQPADKAFSAQTVRLDNKIVGYFHLTEGEPLPDLVWISMLVLHPSVQGQHLGQEIVSGLIAHYSRARFHRAIWLEVYSKNWPAMSFWIRQGFTRIIEYGGSKGEKGGSLVLERPL